MSQDELRTPLLADAIADLIKKQGKEKKSSKNKEETLEEKEQKEDKN